MRSKRGDSGAHAAILLTLGIIILTSTIGVFIAFSTAKVASSTYATSKAKFAEVTQSLKPLELIAQKSSPRELEYIYEIVELSYSSREGMRVDELSIVLNLKDNTTIYEYNSRINCSVNPLHNVEITSLSNPNNKGYFGANTRINTNAPDVYEGYITRWNVAKLCFRTPRPLTEDEKLTIKIIPTGGSTLVTSLTLPPVFVTDYVRLLDHIV